MERNSIFSFYFPCFPTFLPRFLFVLPIQKDINKRSTSNGWEMSHRRDNIVRKELDGLGYISRRRKHGRRVEEEEEEEEKVD